MGFDFNKLERKYKLSIVDQKKVLPYSDTPYVEFDEPIEMLIKARNRELWRNIGLISPYGILYVNSDCFITITSCWRISCEGYGEITPYDDPFKFIEWAQRIKDDMTGRQELILSDEEDFVI